MATEKTSAQVAEEIAGVHPMRVARADAKHRHVRGGFDNGGDDGMGNQYPNPQEEVPDMKFRIADPPMFDEQGWPSR